MNITISGAGYVGVSNALLLAQKNDVIVFDISSEKVALLNSSKAPFKDSVIETFLTNKELNFSPLREFSNVEFVRTTEDFKFVLLRLSEESNVVKTKEKFFWIDQELPRWRDLLKRVG